MNFKGICRLLIVVNLFIIKCNWAISATVSDVDNKNWTTPPVLATNLHQVIFQSAVVKEKVSYHIYLPESYDKEKDKNFPVLYWLHGHGGGNRGLPRLVEYFHNAIKSKKIQPFIIVFPNGMYESMWCNSKDGSVPMETVLINELIPQVDSQFRTIKSKNERILEGFSMGGYGTARLGFKYPDLFGAISILGAGPMQRKFDTSIGPPNLAPDRIRVLKNVYGNDQDYFFTQSPWYLADQFPKNSNNAIAVRIVVGAQDVMKGPNEEFSAHLSNLKIPHEITILPLVKHDPLQIFNALRDDNLKFYEKFFSKK